MRRPLEIALFSLTIAASAGAQAGVPGAPPKMTQAEATLSTLTKLEDAWATALVRRDRATFERLLSPKFVYTEDDRTMTRSAFLQATFAPGEVVTEAKNDSMEVHVFGNTGIVVGWLTVKGRNRDGPYDRRYRFTDVWMPRSGTWQIIAAHDYLIPVKK